MSSYRQSIEAFVAERNGSKFLFTAGPASLLPHNLRGLRPCFGRGDADYAELEEAVLSQLKKLSGHQNVARLQGAASLALEVMTLNFLTGKVLIVQTGFYSERLRALAEAAKRMTGAVSEVDTIDWRDLPGLSGSYDWLVACYTETSCALKLNVFELKELATGVGAQLMLDATASIGLEEGHEKADVIGYSSCKGLFGLTGAAFIAYNQPPKVKVDSFNLSLDSHIEKMMTGPYHALCSLAEVLPIHSELRKAVFLNKQRFCESASKFLVWPEHLQPQLCTHVDGVVESLDVRVVLYKPRNIQSGSVVCHLGEVHLGQAAQGEILKSIRIRGV